MQKMEEIRKAGSQVSQEKGYVSNQLQGLELAMEKLESLDDVEDRALFEIVGPLIVELKDKDDAEDLLQEELDQLRSRMQELEETEQDMKQKFQDLQEEVQEEMGGGPPGQGSPPGAPQGPQGHQH